METSFKIPFYAKAALISISAFAFIYTLHVGQQIIIPILYATILAILLNPLVNFLASKKISKIMAIAMVVTLTILVAVGLLYLLSSQVSMFSETYPELKAKFNKTSTEFVHWLSEKFNIRVSKINAWSKETQSDAIDNFAYGERITEVGEIILVTMLLPVYLSMILYYKPLLLEFVSKLFRSEHHSAVTEILAGTKRIIQSYVTGLFFELIIVAILNSAGLLLLGIPYAIILGIIGAILNLIPYIGGIVAIALPMIIAFVTKDSLTYPVLVLCLYLLIQFIDNNYIIPKIVASKVQINALISVIAVLIGGALWGISGMFLSIPLTAIMKVVFDHIEPLKPWGYLIGDVVPTASRFSFIKKVNTLMALPVKLRNRNPVQNSQNTQ
ncbi:MAG: AI-2E family transporter [Cyclobacteriaceae bacterium]